MVNFPIDINSNSKQQISNHPTESEELQIFIGTWNVAGQNFKDEIMDDLDDFMSEVDSS